MRVISAYLLAVLGGNESPNADDIKTILDSVSIEADSDRVDQLLQIPKQLKQDLNCLKDAQVLPSNAIDGIQSCFEAQSSPLEKGLSRQELFEALSGQKLKTLEGSKHKSKVQGGGGQGQSSDADSDVTVTTPEQVESRWSTPGAAAQSVRRHGQQQRSASTNI